MNTQKVTSLETLVTGRSWLLAEDPGAKAEEARWTANLRQRRIHYRSFDVVTPEGSFVIEYYGKGMDNEWILVDGQVAACGRSTWWYTPHFEFQIGSAHTVLAVRYWPWLTLRWLRLIVNGQIVYSEGSAGHGPSADELLAAVSDPLALDGIEIEGQLPASLSLPRQIFYKQEASGVKLTQRWFSWMAVMMVPFCLLLDAAVLFAYVLVPKGDLAFAASLLLLPGVLMALGASYYVLARLVNRTVVRVRGSRLSIWHGPLPWAGNQSVAASQVKGFRCEKRILRNYAGDIWETYTLSAFLEDGRELELLHGIGSFSAAHILEQWVAGWLVTAKQASVAPVAV
jgi:hypothetical protein